MAYAQNRTTNLSSAIPIRAMSRMKIRAMRAFAICAALLTDLLVRGNGIAGRERTTLDLHRGRRRRLWSSHKRARAG